MLKKNLCSEIAKISLFKRFIFIDDKIYILEQKVA